MEFFRISSFVHQWNSSEYLLLCAEVIKSYRSGKTWG